MQTLGGRQIFLCLAMLVRPWRGTLMWNPGRSADDSLASLRAPSVLTGRGLDPVSDARYLHQRLIPTPARGKNRSISCTSSPVPVGSRSCRKHLNSPKPEVAPSIFFSTDAGCSVSLWSVALLGTRLDFWHEIRERPFAELCQECWSCRTHRYSCSIPKDFIVERVSGNASKKHSCEKSKKVS